MPVRRKNTIDPLELTPGDPVVHNQHGVGRYVEMVQRSVAGSVREYLVIEYAPSKRGQPGDRLYVPMDSLDQVTRYVGGEHPTLDKMGGADWSKRKGRARKAVREIAGELIKLYAARQASRGHAFSADTTWQRELEDAFSFVETPDQLAAIDEVKADMEQIVPMDRLICGDVGYGKTEIAVRAAFKAVQDGKQVAVLVPTTLLVQQHYATFADRYAGLPGQRRPAQPLPDRRGVQGDQGGRGRRQGRRDRRHPPAAQRRDPVQGPRSGDHRRGAALRRRAQGAAEAAADGRRRAGHVGHADPAHPGDGHHRHPGDEHHRHPAGGAAPGAHLRRSVRRGPADRRHPPRAAARGSGLLHPQPGAEHRQGGQEAGRAGARGPGGDRPRPDGGAAAGAGDGRLLGAAGRRAGLHHDRRGRAGHLHRQHPADRAGRPARSVPAAPAPRPGRPRPGARLRLLLLPAGEAADRDRARPAGDHRRAHRPRARAWRWP